MKKLFTVLAVLLVATALFAGVTVKAGGTFAFASLNTATDADHDESMNMKAHGFGFDAGVQYDISDKLAVYGEFNMVFPKDADVVEGEEPYKVSDLVKEIEDIFAYVGATNPSVSSKINYFSVSAGVAYKLDFNAVKLAVGGGLSLNRSAMTIKGSGTIDDEDYSVEIKQSFTNIGLNALVDAKYMVAEKVGVGVTLNPQLGLYNITTEKNTNQQKPDDNSDETVKGFKVSFAMPITVGVSYTF